MVEVYPSVETEEPSGAASVPTVQDVSRILRALSDPTRLRILDLLMGGVQCNCELGEHLHLPMNLISHHVRVLRESGLVTSRRDPNDARWIYYSIDGATLGHVRKQLAAFLDPQRIQQRLPNCGPHARPAPSVRTARRQETGARRTPQAGTNTSGTNTIPG